jgi:hypothetical protein
MSAPPGILMEEEEPGQLEKRIDLEAIAIVVGDPEKRRIGKERDHGASLGAHSIADLRAPGIQADRRSYPPRSTTISPRLEMIVFSTILMLRWPRSVLRVTLRGRLSMRPRSIHQDKAKMLKHTLRGSLRSHLRVRVIGAKLRR